MAKGKQATHAANRRAEAAHEVIDRLTSDLADARIRYRDAEARADRLEGIEKLIESASPKNDEALATAIEKLKYWERTAKSDARRRTEAIHELYRKVWPDIARGDLSSGPEDRREFFFKRYPKIIMALSASDVDPSVDEPVPVRGPLSKAEWKMSGESLKRFQKMCGHRAITVDAPGVDLADIVIDLLDAQQVGFSHSEMMELVFPDARDA